MIGVGFMFTLLVISVVVLAAAVLFAFAARRGAAMRNTIPESELDAESRSIYLGIKRLVTNVEDAASQATSLAAKYVANEARDEAHRIRAKVEQILSVRTKLSRLSRDFEMTKRDVIKLEAEVVAGKSESDSLLESKRRELHHLSSVHDSIVQIDRQCEQAKLVLTEMRTRLTVSVADDLAGADDQDSLREAVGRMRALSQSVDELSGVIGKE